MFCKNVIPKGSDYTVEASYDETMDYYRFAYYVYPLLRDLDDPEYIVCYKVNFSKEGYEPAAHLEGDKYILKKVKRR